MKRTFIFLLAILPLEGCTKKEGLPTQPVSESPYSATVDSISISDDAILQLVYSQFEFPEGFYHEDLADTGIYYENTISVSPLSARPDYSSELSTNDHNQALAWSESSAVFSAYYRSLLYESQTEKYFQFCRVYQAHPSDVLFSRVHKLSYLDRSMFDYFHPTPLIGVLNFKPIDSSSVRTLIQYLWFTHNYNVEGSKALATPVSESSDSVFCALYLVQTNFGDIGMPDQIRLTRELYAVDKQSGKIFLSTSIIRTIQGKSR